MSDAYAVFDGGASPDRGAGSTGGGGAVTPDYAAPRVSGPVGLLEAPVADEPLYAGLRLSTWVKIGTLTVLMAAVFWPNLRRLFYKTNPISGEANWGHSFCIPFIGLYYLYVNRDALLAAEVRPLVWTRFSRNRVISTVAMIAAGLAVVALGPVLMPTQTGNLRSLGGAAALLGMLSLLLDWGWGTLLFGLICFQYGIWPGQNDWVKDFGMVVTLFGVVLMLCGWDVMKTAWFPIAFLVCALPWPGLVYSWVAGPLQVLAAKVAVFTLELTGVRSYHFGTKIFIYGHNDQLRTLNVAEACAGLRSLMTFVSVGGAIAFLSNRPLWQKLTITASAIPIAIGCNVMRVSGQGLFDRYVSQEFSEGFAHQFVGLAMLIPAFFLILLVGWLLDQLFIEEAEEVADTTERIVRRAPVATNVATTPASAAAAASLAAAVIPAPQPAAVVAAPAPTVIRRAPAAPAAAPKPAAAAPKPTAPSAPPAVAKAAPQPPTTARPAASTSTTSTPAPKPAAVPKPAATPRQGVVPPPPTIRLAARAPGEPRPAPKPGVTPAARAPGAKPPAANPAAAPAPVRPKPASPKPASPQPPTDSEAK